MEEQAKKKVEELFRKLMKIEGVSREQARRKAHLYVCGGTCKWFKQNARQTGFDPTSLSADQRVRVKQAMEAAFPGMDQSQTKKLIHQYICG